MDEKPIQKLYYSIGEVSSMLNLSSSQIRFWEQEFDMLKPGKNKKGNRIYTSDDIETLRLIFHLTKEKGYTIQGAREKIKHERHAGLRELQILESLKKVKQFLIDLRNDL